MFLMGQFPSGFYDLECRGDPVNNERCSGGDALLEPFLFRFPELAEPVIARRAVTANPVVTHVALQLAGFAGRLVVPPKGRAVSFKPILVLDWVRLGGVSDLGF
jgi:hypothetical protein